MGAQPVGNPTTVRTGPDRGQTVDGLWGRPGDRNPAFSAADGRPETCEDNGGRLTCPGRHAEVNDQLPANVDIHLDGAGEGATKVTPALEGNSRERPWGVGNAGTQSYPQVVDVAVNRYRGIF